MVPKEKQMDFADYRYIDDGHGGGTVLVPFVALDVAFGAFGAAPSRLEVLDHDAREVDFVGGGPTYFADSEAGTKEFAGWSYWEDEATEDPGAPCVQLFILAPDFPESSYPGVC